MPGKPGLRSTREGHRWAEETIHELNEAHWLEIRRKPINGLEDSRPWGHTRELSYDNIDAVTLNDLAPHVIKQQSTQPFSGRRTLIASPSGTNETAISEA